MFKRLVILAVLLYALNAYGQKWEFGTTFGFANYQGDVAPDISLNETNYSSGIFVKRNLSQFFSLTLGYYQGKISGSDANYNHLKRRNLSFESTIYELSHQLEFNFFPFSVGLHPNKYTPYAFTGISVFRHDPKTSYNGEFIRLNPLDTEGNKLEEDKNNPYSLYQLAIPIGGGFKFKISSNFNGAFFVSFRYAFTDYLDDVSTTYYDLEFLEDEYGELASTLSDRSYPTYGFQGKQRGRADLTDWYIFGGISITYRFKNNVCFEF